MSNDKLIKLCELANLGNLTSPPTKVTGGLLHLMWHVITNTNEYAIKELNKRIVVDDQIKTSYELTERVARAFFERGISAVTSLQSNKKSIIEIDNTFFIIYPWVNGITLDINTINLHHAKRVGDTLARMHSLSLNFPELSTPEWDLNTNERLEELTNKSINVNLPFAKSFKESLVDIFSWNTRYQMNISVLNNYLVVSHGDLDPKNVIWKDGMIAMLIDWESARLLNPTQEIINAALDWSGITLGNINIKIFKATLAEYKKSGGKIKVDQTNAAFCAVIGNWINWLRYNIERSLGENISTEEERQLGINQVQTTLKIFKYLNNHSEDLIKVVDDLQNINVINQEADKPR